MPPSTWISFGSIKHRRMPPYLAKGGRTRRTLNPPLPVERVNLSQLSEKPMDRGEVSKTSVRLRSTAPSARGSHSPFGDPVADLKDIRAKAAGTYCLYLRTVTENSRCLERTPDQPRPQLQRQRNKQRILRRRSSATIASNGLKWWTLNGIGLCTLEAPSNTCRSRANLIERQAERVLFIFAFQRYWPACNRKKSLIDLSL